MLASTSTFGTQRELQCKNHLLLGHRAQSAGCRNSSWCGFPKATSGGACVEMTARQLGVDYNCEQRGLFILFILPDILSLLKANVWKSSVSLNLHLYSANGAVNVTSAGAVRDELLPAWSVWSPCANRLQATRDPMHSFKWDSSSSPLKCSASQAISLIILFRLVSEPQMKSLLVLLPCLPGWFPTLFHMD